MLLGCAAGCSRGEPPTPVGDGAVVELGALVAGADGAAGVADSGAGAPPPGASTAAAPGGDGGVDPASLPQTRDRPAAAGPAFEARAAALWTAIVADDPERAMPFFFPLGAYQQVKDISDPASDWKHRLVSAYARDIHALHRRLGDDAASATFVGIDVPDPRARWVDPGEEYNKIGYWRVFGSKLRWRLGDQERSSDVKSLISWRGEWYVVHLSAIK